MKELPDIEGAISPPPGSTPSEMFPVLTSGQQARVLAHGRRRSVEQDEIVVELNEHVTKVFVVFCCQAEDGIRSGRVTGVQTCALPISSSRAIAVTQRASSLRRGPVASAA